MKRFILKTRLAENSRYEFYYQGTATEPNVSLVMNTIVALDAKHAKAFKNHNDAFRLCSLLNADLHLREHGYSNFEIEVIE